jgi:DNA invertase Pin-like site-specific DNA recombinase
LISSGLAKEVPVFAYLRVSTDKQTVENQRLQIKDFAHSNGFALDPDDWFEDPETSGKTPALERSGFGTMISILKDLPKEERPAHVIFYEVSRVGRTFWEILDAIRILEDLAPIISTSPRESFLRIEDPSMRQIFISFLAWAAQKERQDLVQRTNDGLARARSQKRHSGNIPLGYDMPHVCVRLGHDKSKCNDPMKGRLVLNKRGRRVLELLEDDDKLSAKTIKEELGIEKSKEAWNLLKSVKKFGDPQKPTV